MRLIRHSMALHMRLYGTALAGEAYLHATDYGFMPARAG